ncbi:MAG: hypothetical protein HWQ38_06640 [Nostoc sp. NMS7]|uniref:hypothetical protein n=1 Tax=Nostoc sp. NMS7 TaxID=2815391 RepID=UPI0025DEF9FA|nr:hypothetical protein [Nostoc sp. NMS7]MBN3946170.1 hypothetical protein [Nostoc sp. NMS7]
MSTTGYAYAPLVAEQSLIKCFSIKIKRSQILDKERKRLHFCNYPDKCDRLSQLPISTSDGFI